MCQALAVWSSGPGGVGLKAQLERGHGARDFADEQLKTRRCVEGRFNMRKRLGLRRVHRRASTARLGAGAAAAVLGAAAAGRGAALAGLREGGCCGGNGEQADGGEQHGFHWMSPGRFVF